jgi:hypothetical protein
LYLRVGIEIGSSSTPIRDEVGGRDLGTWLVAVQVPSEAANI